MKDDKNIENRPLTGPNGLLQDEEYREKLLNPDHENQAPLAEVNPYIPANPESYENPETKMDEQQRLFEESERRRREEEEYLRQKGERDLFHWVDDKGDGYDDDGFWH